MDEQEMSMAEIGPEEIEDFSGEEIFTEDAGEDAAGEEAPQEGQPDQAAGEQREADKPEEAEPAPPETGKETGGQEIAFNAGGKAYRMTMEELQDAAIRGIEAQGLYQEREALRNSPERQLVARLAAQSGVSVEDYVRNVEAQLRETEINRMKESGVPEEYARRMLELERKEKEREAAEAEARKKEAVNRDFREFVAAYPEVQRFPPEVAQAIKGGKKPLEAYQAYENRQLKAEIAALKKNAENRGKVPGSLQGEGGQTESDPFLDGFGG